MEREREAYICNLRQNTCDHVRLKPYVVYGELIDYRTGDLIASMTLDDLARVIEDRSLKLVFIDNAPVKYINGRIKEEPKNEPTNPTNL